MNDNSIDSDQFRRACGLWGSGVSIVTTVDAAGTPYGLTMNAVSSLSLNPAMFLVCVDNGSDTLPPMLESRVYCVNILTQQQQDLSNRFAKKGQDKFSGVTWSSGVTSAPIIAQTLISLECEVSNVYEGGDHQIFCGVVRGLVSNEAADAEPLLFYSGRYAELVKS